MTQLKIYINGEGNLSFNLMLFTKTDQGNYRDRSNIESDKRTLSLLLSVNASE